MGQAGVPTKFCGGRTDATADNVYPAEYLKPNGNYSASVEDMRLGAAMAGLTDTEWVVLNAGDTENLGEVIEVTLHCGCILVMHGFTIHAGCDYNFENIR